SEGLQGDTFRWLGVACDLRVIPNFIDCESNQRVDASAIRRRLAPNGEKLVIHVSNFRPVKRGGGGIAVFSRVRKLVPSRLLMVGDGPDLGEAVRLAQSMNLGDSVQFLGEQD